MKKLILIGAGGHSKVIIDMLKCKTGVKIIGLVDKTKEELGQEVLKVPIIGSDEDLEMILANKQANYALIAVGSTGDNTLRANLYRQVKNIGYKFINAVHPTAAIGKEVEIGCGNAIMAKTAINSGAKLGNNNIVNTGSVIEHDVKIGNHVHVGPGVKLSGGVTIGNYSHIGTGATAIQNIKIGNNCLVGAGTVLIEDVPDNTVIVGNPGQIIRYRGDSNE